jgi:hypothetical protein
LIYVGELVDNDFLRQAKRAGAGFCCGAIVGGITFNLYW